MRPMRIPGEAFGTPGGGMRIPQVAQAGRAR